MCVCGYSLSCTSHSLSLSALIGFAAYLSHLHLKTCAPAATNEGKPGDTVGLYVTVKVAIISGKEQEKRLELIRVL